MSQGRSLSPAQIQYLRIGPKAGASSTTKNQLTDAIRQEKNKQYAGETSATSSLNKIPKLTYGQFEKTISNFGVLINKNFGNQTSVHQSQKFGKMAQYINHIMLQEKDKPIFNEKKNALLKKIKDRSDNRTSIKTVYEFMGQKIHVTLKSFSLQSEHSNEGGLPIPYLRFLIGHVKSSRLAKIIQGAVKAEGNQIVVQFDKIESRANHFSNNEAKYQNQSYQFQRLGQILRINLPHIQFHEPQSGFLQKASILNKQIMQTIETNFDNVSDIVDKYLDISALKNSLQDKHKAEEQQVSHDKQVIKDKLQHREQVIEDANQGEAEEQEDNNIDQQHHTHTHAHDQGNHHDEHKDNTDHHHHHQAAEQDNDDSAMKGGLFGGDDDDGM